MGSRPQYIIKSLFVFAILLLPVLVVTACPKRQTTGDDGLSGTTESAETSLIDIPGLYLVYTVNDPRGATIGANRIAHVLIADPGSSRRDVLFSYPGFVFHVAPSPDGTRIAFVGSVWGGFGQDERHLFIYDIKKDSYMDVSAPGFYSRAVKNAPVFTSDSRWVIFMSRWALDSGEYNVFKCEVESGRIEGLYTEPVEDVPLTMMPDGTACIAVRRDPLTAFALEYASIDVDTGVVTPLHEFSGLTKLGPAHPDSTGRIIYCDIKPSDESSYGVGGTRSREVISLNLDTGGETHILASGTVTYVYQFFIDADGVEKLLLRRQEDIEGEDTPMSRIATCLTDGTDFTYLTDTSARSYLLPPPSNIPPIAPDNSLLFYYRQDPVFEHEDIWIMKPDGSDSVNISNTAGYNEGSAGWIVIR